MKSAVVDLLELIASGVTIYEPFGRTSQDLQSFQDTVERLKEMEREGLVQKLFLQFRAGTQVEDQIELVMVQGRLTNEGERLLKDQG